MATRDHEAEALDVRSCPRPLLVEQVMRRAGDDYLIAAFLDAPARSLQLLAATGRLLAVSPGPIPPGSPLQIWAAGGALDPDWRSFCHPVAGSVWGELATLSVLCNEPLCEPAPGDTTLDPYIALIELRRRRD